jgi:uncharacterized protein YjbJ (UPF0337 family)
MYNDTLKGQWNTLKRKLKELWRDLTDDDTNNNIRNKDGYYEE